MDLAAAIHDPKYQDHRIGDLYTMDGKPDLWKIAYYPIFENGKTGKIYQEPRALIEKPIPGGTDFREIPLRYLTKSKGLARQIQEMMEEPYPPIEPLQKWVDKHFGKCTT